jgi:quercetin dioxygenase-like cupin family protein
MLTVRPGTEFVNPTTGEHLVVLVAPTIANGGLLVADVFVPPGGSGIGDHLHPGVEEVVTVKRGHLDLRVGGAYRVAIPGDRVEIPAGVVHDWWNAGDYDAHVRLEACPGHRLLEAIATLYAAAGEPAARRGGRPSWLQLVLLARAFDDVFVLRRLPRWAARAAHALLAPMARRRGVRASYPDLLARLSPAPGTRAIAS